MTTSLQESSGKKKKTSFICHHILKCGDSQHTLEIHNKIITWKENQIIKLYFGIILDSKI